jgi:hypothetical protein
MDMKIFLQILVLLTAFSLVIFSQHRIDGKQFNEETLKSDNNKLQMELRNQQREFYQEEGFDAKDTMTTINNSLLSNGFLLIEQLIQRWDDSAWVNRSKSSYKYDVYNNMIELLKQYWKGSNLANWSKKNTYTYDGNNNLTEWLVQNWDDSAWVFGSKTSNTYDGNNNRTV